MAVLVLRECYQERIGADMFDAEFFRIFLPSDKNGFPGLAVTLLLYPHQAIAATIGISLTVFRTLGHDLG